jgi:hypothetical protein
VILRNASYHRKAPTRCSHVAAVNAATKAEGVASNLYIARKGAVKNVATDVWHRTLPQLSPPVEEPKILLSPSVADHHSSTNAFITENSRCRGAIILFSS